MTLKPSDKTVESLIIIMDMRFSRYSGPINENTFVLNSRKNHNAHKRR